MKRIKWKRCAALCALLGLCMALAACGASQSTAASTGTAAAQEDSAQASTLEAGGTTALQLPQDGRKLIMNAELTVEALDFDATLTALREAAEQAGGYVSSTYLEGEADSGSRYAHYEFRIPAEQYSTFLAAADGAGNVTQKSESVQDVTAQYVDVEARLASLEAQRESLNAMLAQAQDVETLLAVQRELADVQYEIESYTAQKRTYDDQIAYSTVQVTVHEVRRVTENPQSFASRLGAAFRSGWYGLGQGVQSLAVGGRAHAAAPQAQKAPRTGPGGTKQAGGHAACRPARAEENRTGHRAAARRITLRKNNAPGAQHVCAVRPARQCAEIFFACKAEAAYTCASMSPMMPPPSTTSPS